MAKDKLILKNIEVRKSPIHRYGVFAINDIKKDTIIEEAPSVILMDNPLLPDPLNDYAFGNVTDENTYFQLLPFGYASIINHSDKPNTEWYFDEDNEIIVFITIKDIKKDEEIFHDYGENWFQVREAAQILNKLEDNFNNGKISINDLRKKLND